MGHNNKQSKSYYLHIPSAYRSFFLDLARDHAEADESSLSEVITRTFVDSVLPHDESLRRYALIPYTGGSVIDSVRQVLNDSWLAQSAPLGGSALDFADSYIFPLTECICQGRDTSTVLDESRLIRENLLQLLTLGELSTYDSDRCRKLLPLLNGPVTINAASDVFKWLNGVYGRLTPKVQPICCGIVAMLLSGVCSLLGPDPSDYEWGAMRLEWCWTLRESE